MFINQTILKDREDVLLWSWVQIYPAAKDSMGKG
jgi:hypothetical protein